MSVLPRHRLVHALLTASLGMPMNLSGQAPPPTRIELLVRIDDIGMSHAVNQALQELADTHSPDRGGRASRAELGMEGIPLGPRAGSGSRAFARRHGGVLQ